MITIIIELSSLMTVQSTLPNVTELVYPLQIISTSIAGLPNNLTLYTALGVLYVAGNEFPDINPVYDALIATGDSIRDQTTFRELIGNGTLVTFNESLNSLPDLTSARQVCAPLFLWLSARAHKLIYQMWQMVYQ
jgi:hypothetical protein